MTPKRLDKERRVGSGQISRLQRNWKEAFSLVERLKQKVPMPALHVFKYDWIPGKNLRLGTGINLRESISIKSFIKFSILLLKKETKRWVVFNLILIRSFNTGFHWRVINGSENSKILIISVFC